MRAPLRQLDRRWPAIGVQLHQIKQGLERSWARDPQGDMDPAAREQFYQDDAEVRAREYTGYRYVAACETCSLRSICDGVHGDYVDMFGVEGIRPVDAGSAITDPQHYTRRQLKVIHPLDRDWVEGEAARPGSAA
jgi:hypothetical protein